MSLHEKTVMYYSIHESDNVYTCVCTGAYTCMHVGVSVVYHITLTSNKHSGRGSGCISSGPFIPRMHISPQIINHTHPSTSLTIHSLTHPHTNFINVTYNSECSRHSHVQLDHTHLYLPPACKQWH